MADKPTKVAKAAAKRGPRGAIGKTGATGRTGKQAVTPDAYLQKADKLQRSLDGVRREMQRQTDEIEAANTTATKANQSADRAKSASRVALAGVALALIGVAIGGIAIRTIITVRAGTRVTACQSERRFQVNHNGLVANTQGFAGTLLTDAANDPENLPKRDFILQYGRDRVAEFAENVVPVRICDGPSIALFYRSKGELGCEKTTMNPKGECLQPKPRSG